jgi:MFS family permease
VTARAIIARIWVLMGAGLIDMMGLLMVLPLLPFYAERLGATPSLVGVLVAAHAFAQLATAPLWGRLSDRLGRRPVILLGLATSAGAYLLFALAHQLWLLLLSRLVQGAAGGITGVIQAYVSDSVPEEERTRALGWLTTATSAGVALGPALALITAPLGPQAPGFLAAGLALLNVAFAARFLAEPASERLLGVRRRLRHALVDVLRHPTTPAHRLIWIYTAGMMAFMAMNGVLGLYLGRRFGVTDKTIGYFYLYTGVVSVLMRGVMLGPASRRFGDARVQQLGTLALLLGLLLLPLPTHWAWLALVIPLMPIGTALLFPTTTAQLSRHAPRGHVGETMGVQQAFGGVARMVGPIGAGIVFEHLGMAWPFWLAAALMAAAGTMAWRVPRAPRPAPGPGAGAGEGTASGNVPDAGPVVTSGRG